MLILEGPDGSGKTTLGEFMSKELKWPVAPKVVLSNTEAMVNLQRWTEENTARGFQRTIFDRHRLISDPIYRFALDKPRSPGLYDYHWLNVQMEKFVKAEPIIVYCLPPLREVKFSVEHDTANMRVAPYISKIYDMYIARSAVDFAQRTFTRGTPDNMRGPVSLLYDYTRMSPDEILHTVEYIMHRRND